jgi:copper transport protein
VAVVANGLHTTTAMVWFGGLVGLGLVLRWRWRSDGADVGATAAMVARFSTLAGACVAVLLAAGAVLSWQEVGSRAAFTSTTYGRVLLAKVLVVLVVLVAAAYNRFVLVPDIDHLVDEPPDDADGPDDELHGLPDRPDHELGGSGGLATVASTSAPAAAWSRLATSMKVEVLGVVVVLAITAVLVSVTPARGVSNEARVFNQTQPAGDLDVNLVVTPAAAGLNALHIQYLDDTGRPVDQPQLLETELSLPADDIGPLRQPALRAGPGHFILDDANLPIAGTWEITLVARLSDFEQTRTTFQVRVAP